MENKFIKLDTEDLQAVSKEQAWHYRLIPKSISDQRFECYIDEKSFNLNVQEELEIITGKEVVLDAIASDLVERTLKRYYLKNNNLKNKQSEKTIDMESEQFVVQLIAEAKSLDSSDIHVEAYEEKCRVRMRIDGKLVERFIIKSEDYPSFVNKIKIMADLDIAEKRLPQDGRIFFDRDGYKFDIRVSVLPTLHGEKIVLRLLGSDASNIDLHQLGFTDQDLENYLQGVKQPNGIMLISGPTGSGKTTTLYATLKLLNKESNNIITIEDPIEYTLEGINQVQLKENIGLDFAQALRTFLRQDPDIVMVGEIRDADTANMAIRAALTGHLVLSTIHTNSAWGTISRLIDMGVPAYLLANTLNTAVAQRLVRALCPDCKEKSPFKVGHGQRNFQLLQPVQEHFLPKGCDSCYHTGYKGRKALYEVVAIDEELSQLIKDKEYNIKEQLGKRGIKSLAENAIQLFKDGETSFDEIYPFLFSY